MTIEQNKRTLGEFFERFSAAPTVALELLDDAVVWRAMGREGGPADVRRNGQASYQRTNRKCQSHIY